MPTRKRDPVSFRLSPEAHEALRDLAAQLGISQASVVEMAVRQLAQKLGKGKG
jgi:predicted DNA-binding protein